MEDGFDCTIDVTVAGDHLGYLSFYVRVSPSGEIDLQTPETRVSIPDSHPLIGHPLIGHLKDFILEYWRDEVADCRRAAIVARIEHDKEIARAH